MKAITIWQPWAGMVAAGIKQNETRSWPTKYRGPIAIHAAKKSIQVSCIEVSDKAMEVICRRLNLPEIFNGPDTFPMGCIVATANLTDCIKITPEYISTLSSDELALGNYTVGRYAWVMTDTKKLDFPIPVKGRQGLWNWDDTKHER